MRRDTRSGKRGFESARLGILDLIIVSRMHLPFSQLCGRHLQRYDPQLSNPKANGSLTRISGSAGNDAIAVLAAYLVTGCADGHRPICQLSFGSNIVQYCLYIISVSAQTLRDYLYCPIDKRNGQHAKRTPRL